MSNFLHFTAALDGLDVAIIPEQVIYVRLTRPGPEGDLGAQGTLIVTTGASPDNRVVVSEPPNIVEQLIDQAKASSAGRSSKPLPARKP
jgi:hypothetical protein